MGRYFIESLPIAFVYLSIALLIVVSCETGFLLGRHHHRTREDKEAPGSVGPIVGGLMGMLAFVLAFTFSMASTQHGVRKQNVLDEANVIDTAYLRADLLDLERAADMKTLLREYVDVRLQAVQPGANVPAAVARSLDIHDRLWADVSSAAREQPGAITALVAQSVNDVIEMHETRLASALRSRIPGSVWIGLMAITVLTMMTLGLQVGLSGKRRMVAVVPLSLTFAVLVTLVVDLNRPTSGSITVSQQAMKDLQSTMRRSQQ